MSAPEPRRDADLPGAAELPAGVRSQLLDPSDWQEPLEKYAGATALAVALTDAEGRLLGRCLNPQPTWSLFHGRKPPGGAACPFALAPLTPGLCVARALAQGVVVVTHDRTGLVHFAVPLVLEGKAVGAVVAGQVFTQYPEQMALEHLARQFGLPPEAVWQTARLEHPVKEATLRVYADLLRTLSQAFLQTRYDRLVEARRRAERDQAEEARRQTEQRLGWMVESVKEYALFSCDPEGLIDTWNEGAARLFGYAEAEVLGRSAAVLFTPEDRAAGVPEQELATAARTGQANDVRWHVRKDGSRFFVEGSVTTVRDGAGALRGFMKVAHDMTERKRAEEALQDADRRKDEFLAMLAHELRNPLAPLRTGLHLLGRSSGDQGEPFRRAHALMERQLEHLVRLVDDLLDVRRITRGQIGLRTVAVDLADVVARAVESSRPLIDARGHLLEVTLPREPLPLQADPVRLAQALLNLLNNAAKYTPEGGRITLTAVREGGAALVRVCDTGMGIAAEMLPRIFELFTQLEHGSDRAQGGLGIGLTLARRLVEMHGGTLEAFSPGPGQGSEFVVRLPLREAQPPAAEPGESSAEVPRTTPAPARRILVVDDNRDAADSLATVLKLFGHDVRAAHDGRQALAVAAVYHPQVVLLDLGLPGMDGYEVARQLRSLPGLAAPLLVALTGYGTEEDRRRTRLAGFDAHLVKPAELAAVQELVASLESRGEHPS